MTSPLLRKQAEVRSTCFMGASAPEKRPVGATPLGADPGQLPGPLPRGPLRTPTSKLRFFTMLIQRINNRADQGPLQQRETLVVLILDHGESDPDSEEALRALSGPSFSRELFPTLAPPAKNFPKSQSPF